jgi:Borealin
MLNHIKSASADRMGTITPKVQPYHPMAMLRHAKAGEAIFSLSGSPVVTSSITEETANVNIPILNGVLSIRPTEMQSVDAQFVSRLDNNTISQLQQLKDNLDMILRAKKY